MTIEEKIQRECVVTNSRPSYVLFDDVVRFATEQDRIARNEERERCIREAMYASCSRCYFYHNGECVHEEIAGFRNDCSERMKRIRKAIEEGGES